MCSMSVLCPLCAQTSFSSIDALRSSLIKAANGPLSCPICHELFLGLDKLTIHLFSHTTLMTTMETTATATAITMSPTAPPNVELPTTSEQSSKVTCKTKKMKKIKLNAPDEQVSPNAEQQSGSSSSAGLANCDICEFTFRNESLRDMHFRLVHQNLPTDNTPIRSAPNLSSISSCNSSTEPFKCHLCSKCFKSKGSLRVHLKVAHLKGLPSAATESKLNICERLRHKGDDTEEAAVRMPQSFLLMPQQQQQQQHDPAETSTALAAIHDEHLKPGNNIVVVFNTTAPTTSSTAPSLQQQQTPSYDAFDYEHLNKSLAVPAASGDNPKVWECDICAKCFTTKYFLKKHKRLHTGEMPYTCEICSRTFTFQQSYHKHLLYHSEVKPHVCSTCGRAFKELSTLHNHERIHSGEKPFKCEVCGKSFRQRVSFLVHTRIHTGVMPYKCELCEKSFRYKVSQRTHKCLPVAQNTANLNQTEEPPIKSPLTNENSSNTIENDDVEHLSETFIKAFLERATAQQSSIPSQNSPASAETAALNTNSTATASDEAQLVRTIDEIVAAATEQLQTPTLNGVTPVKPPSNSGSLLGLDISDGSNSPSQQLQRMRLYSPQLVNNVLEHSFECQW